MNLLETMRIRVKEPPWLAQGLTAKTKGFRPG